MFPCQSRDSPEKPLDLLTPCQAAFLGSLPVRATTKPKVAVNAEGCGRETPGLRGSLRRTGCPGFQDEGQAGLTVCGTEGLQPSAGLQLGEQPFQAQLCPGSATLSSHHPEPTGDPKAQCLERDS